MALELGEEKEQASKDESLPPSIVRPMRQIVLETNGDEIHIVKADVAGKIELIGILQALIAHLSKAQ